VHISCDQNINVDNITEDLNSVVLDDMSVCANCGKEGKNGDMNNCNKCKSVKYCNAACKKKHRTKHKKACERRVAELHDEQLFKEPPSREECPICLIPLPLDESQIQFQTCCGKVVCNGCTYAMKMSEGKDLCAFCRTPTVTYDEDTIKRVKNLMDKGNSEAFNTLAGIYYRGLMGMPQDYQKANELYLKAGELGCAEGYYNLGNSYVNGDGVEVDTKKAQHYYELAAIMGDLDARYNLGSDEHRAGNQHRAMKHFVMAAKAGDKESLNEVKEMFIQEVVTKDEYASTLRAYHERNVK